MASPEGLDEAGTAGIGQGMASFQSHRAAVRRILPRVSPSQRPDLVGDVTVIGRGLHAFMDRMWSLASRQSRDLRITRTASATQDSHWANALSSVSERVPGRPRARQRHSLGADPAADGLSRDPARRGAGTCRWRSAVPIRDTRSVGQSRAGPGPGHRYGDGHDIRAGVGPASGDRWSHLCLGMRLDDRGRCAVPRRSGVTAAR